MSYNLFSTPFQWCHFYR